MTFFINCPHCEGTIEIIELNCHIFRHGVYKSNGQQIDPHAPQNICEQLIANNEIDGCGKPFQIIKENDVYVAVVCAYI